jgi:signal transduction histidine kinase/ActR/RegA family two-component response regulator
MSLEEENAQLRERLADAEAVIQAIRHGEIDAVVVNGSEGAKIFTLEGSDHPYRLLVESMNEGAATLSEDGVILFSNPRLASLLGTTTAALAGTPLASWIADSERAHFEHLLRDCRHSSVSSDLTLCAGKLDCLPVHLSLSSLVVKGMHCCCAVLTDMSLAKHHAALAASAEYVRQVNDRLREADKRKDEFLATLAHELRNPLAPIRAAAYMIKKLDVRDERLLQAREVIERQAAHMTRLIDDLLELSRITQGKIELRRRPESLTAIIAGVVQSAQSAMDSRQHQFQIDVAADPLLMEADAIRIAQAVGNVLENATKYTKPGGRIALRARREGSQAVISVRDNGIGIEPQMAARIFDMFVQAENGDRRPNGGLGIGLALSRKMIEMHGGSITVSSPGLGQGAEFEIRLPLSAAQATEAKASAPAGRGPPATTRRVLIVDDNADAADSLCALLQMSGHEARTVYRGVDALREMTSFHPDVVLLDIGLPDLDGYEIARRARASLGERCPNLVALSGWGREEDRELAFEAGIPVHLTKPVDVTTLERVLENSAPLAYAPS